MTDSAIKQDESPIIGLNFAPEWAGTNIFLRCEPVDDRVSELKPEELVLIEKSVQLRRNTFSSGRACARAALEEAGMVPGALLKLDDGSVAWPQGIIGSITHTDNWAIAAIAVAEMSEAGAVGIDLEAIRILDAGVISLIATRAEQTEIADQASPAWHATALFSLKESIYKCLRPTFGRFIEFHDVQITGVASGRPQLQILSRALQQHVHEAELELRMAITPQHVFTLAWRRQG